MQNALICFNDTPPPGVSLPFVNSAASCAANYLSNPLLANSDDTERHQFWDVHCSLQAHQASDPEPWRQHHQRRRTTPQFNVLQPLGSLQYLYYQPVANFSVDLTHGLAWNSGWNYYQYNEGSFVGPTAPRYFHANTVTESLRYSF